MVKTTTWSPKTIQTLIKCLVTKGALAYEKQDRVFVYTPLIDEAEYIGQESNTFLNHFYNGNLAAMLSAYIDNDELSEDEIEGLRSLLSKSALFGLKSGIITPEHSFHKLIRTVGKKLSFFQVFFSEGKAALLPVLPISASSNTQYEATQASLLWTMAATLDLLKGRRPLNSSHKKITLYFYSKIHVIFCTDAKYTDRYFAGCCNDKLTIIILHLLYLFLLF